MKFRMWLILCFCSLGLAITAQAETLNYLSHITHVRSSGIVGKRTLRQNKLPLSSTTWHMEDRAAEDAAIPLLSRNRTGVNATADTVVDEVLPAGFRFTGTISGAGKPILIVARRTDENIFVGDISTDTGKYLIIVPAGTYNLTVCFTPATPGAEDADTTYFDPTSVEVAGDTVRDITLPAVRTSMISGMVSGTSPSALGTLLTFTSSDHLTEGTFLVASTGNYRGELPDGTYTVSLTVPPDITSLQFQSLAIFNIGSATVSGSPVVADFTVPATAKLSGTVRTPALVPAPLLSLVSASDASAPLITTITCGSLPASTIVTTSLDGAYQMILARNRPYDVRVTLPLIQGTDLAGVVFLPLKADQLTLAGDSTMDFTLPQLPGYVTISGRVTDEAGRAVSKAIVGAVTTELPDAPNVGFTSGTIADSNGAYRLLVLSATKYEMIFVPPPAGP